MPRLDAVDIDRNGDAALRIMPSEIGTDAAGSGVRRCGAGQRAPAAGAIVAKPKAVTGFARAYYHMVKIRPGFRILFGSSARLTARIVSISSCVRLIFRYGRFRMPMPCSAEIDPPNSLVI